MKTLYLLRHAKSSWKDPGLDDLDRPLNKRGRESAKTMAAYLRRARISPDVVVCSTALRAKQTLEPIANAIKPPRVTFESRILWGRATRTIEIPPRSPRKCRMRPVDWSQSRFA